MVERRFLVLQPAFMGRKCHPHIAKRAMITLAREGVELPVPLVTEHLRSIVLLGATVACWSIWLHRNDFIFEKKKLNSPLQVIHAISHRLLSWAILRVRSSRI